MFRMRLVCAIALSLCAAAVAAGQPAPTGELPGALPAHLQAEQFGIVTSVRGPPLGVRDQLQKLFGSPPLDIAEPGTPFQSTDVMATPRLPIRRMISAGCSNDHH